MIPIPATVAIALAVALAAGLGHYTGRAVGRQQQIVADLAARTEAIGNHLKRMGKLRTREIAIEQRALATQARIETIYQPIIREAQRYAIDHPDAPDCLAPDGLRLWRSAAAGDAGPGAAAPPGGDIAIPANAAHPRNGDRSGPTGELRPGGAAVSPAAGAIPEPDRVDSHPGR
jgi:hypothetical protein